MAGSLLPQPKQIAFDGAMNPGIAYQFYTYDTGTLTPKATHQDAALTIANTNPVIANARGEVVMYGSGLYRIILKDSLGNTVWDRDPIGNADLSQGGAALVGFLQAGSGAKSRTVQGKLRDYDASLTDFGQGDGTTTDAQAIAAAEASSFKDIYVPNNVTVSNVLLTKTYYGPGKIKTDGIARARRITTVSALPSRGSGEGVYYGGDLTKVQTEEFVIEPTVNRVSLTVPYYDYPLIQHFNRSIFKSGHSGYDAAIATPTIIGTNYVMVTDRSPFTVGEDIVLSPYTNNPENAKITAIDQTTGRLTLQNNLTKVHGSASANTIAAVANSARTHTSVYQTEMDVTGHRVGGDFIAHNTRISCGSTHNLGRNHAFDRTTIGFTAGDSHAYKDGVYVAGHEHLYYDTGTPTGVLESGNIFVIDQVKTFTRTVDNGSFGCVWLGTLYKSEGALPANAAHVVSGKWQRGLDFSIADFGAAQAAASFANGNRLYWGSTSNSDVDGFKFWGNVLGTMYVKGDADGSGNFWEVNVNGAAMLRVRDTAVNIGGALTVTSNVTTTGNIAMGIGGRLNMNGFAGNTYFTFDGTNVFLITNGGIPKQIN